MKMHCGLLFLGCNIQKKQPHRTTFKFPFVFRNQSFVDLLEDMELLANCLVKSCQFQPTHPSKTQIPLVNEVVDKYFNKFSKEQQKSHENKSFVNQEKIMKSNHGIFSENEFAMSSGDAKEQPARCQSLQKYISSYEKPCHPIPENLATKKQVGKIC